MYDRGAGDEIGVGQEALKSHIIERAYAARLGRGTAAALAPARARVCARRLVARDLPDGTDGGDLCLELFMEPGSSAIFARRLAPPDLLDIMGINRRDILTSRPHLP